MAELQKSLNLTTGIGLAVSTIVGSGLLGLPGLALEVGGTEGAVIGWIVTSLISLPLVFLFMKLALTARNAGGVAHVVSLAFGKSIGDAATVVIAATFVLCIPIGTWMGSTYLQRIFDLPEEVIIVIALAVLSICTLFNILGLKPSVIINSLSVVALVVLVLIFAFLNPHYIVSGWNVFSSVERLASYSLHQVWSVCSILFWAYLGWENLSFSTEEIINRPGLIQKIFLLGFLVIMIIYGLLALVSIGANVNGKDVVGITGLLVLVEGGVSSLIVKGLIMVIVIANVNAWVFAASRLVFSGGRSGLFYKCLGEVSARAVPQNSLICLMLVYLVFSALIASNFLPITTGLAVANQNFILLYLIATIAFLKLSSGVISIGIGILSVLSCIFLLSGFGWWIIVPFILSTIGMYLSNKCSEQNVTS